MSIVDDTPANAVTRDLARPDVFEVVFFHRTKKNDRRAFGVVRTTFALLYIRRIGVFGIEVRVREEWSERSG